jgi:hypothetical protein
MMRSTLDHFDAAVEHGGCVISAESSVVFSLVKETIESGNAATFYVTKPQFDAIINSHWTPERRERHKLEAVSLEEQQRIEAGLGIKEAGALYSNRLTCGKCGSVYGAFEFLQQGIREHGKEVVETALNLANAAIVRVNPSTVAICQNCNSIFATGESHAYIWKVYGCNRVD